MKTLYVVTASTWRGSFVYESFSSPLSSPTFGSGFTIDSVIEKQVPKDYRIYR
jgi:hypothetical protein